MLACGSWSGAYIKQKHLSLLSFSQFNIPILSSPINANSRAPPQPPALPSLYPSTLKTSQPKTSNRSLPLPPPTHLHFHLLSLPPHTSHPARACNQIPSHNLQGHHTSLDSFPASQSKSQHHYLNISNQKHHNHIPPHYTHRKV
ncbi:hypothetical protein L207DRAFT_93348 [Hyaloscypha variabilis F]|uniref:Uncharacterized protein n=1 Tax=Hyaloscypha variabilis (strain UAMH 11265 / GT02V1 / F) TaxID=1149755 RepID=A0A2J6REW0_HYAVF|nr:hypothetical protein L207DRAFT_93348 [Hyaloscypha variabilis F]